MPELLLNGLQMKFSKTGMKTSVQQIDRLENITMPLPEEKPLIGFAFPTHGFNAAPIMLRFIAGFPSGLCKDVFLLNTRAGMKLSKIFMPGVSGVALLLPAFILFLKGYQMHWIQTCRYAIKLDFTSSRT